jgi:hypothetical protein
MSTWSRAMKGFRRKGPRPYTAPAREGNWVVHGAHDHQVPDRKRMIGNQYQS